MNADRMPLEVLSTGECLALLASASLGRLALNVGALPVVVPVAYLLTREGILVRAGCGTDLESATRDAVVAFEADEIDPRTGAGWCVSVTGVATQVEDVEDVDALQQAYLRSSMGRWSGPPPDRFVRVSLGLVTGRRAPSTTIGWEQPVLVSAEPTPLLRAA